MAESSGRGVLFVRRARAPLALLALLVAVAVHAPLIANREPLRLVGLDRGAFEAARASLEPSATRLRDLVSHGVESWRLRNATREFEEQIAVEQDALLRRVTFLRTHLEERDRGLLAPLERSIDAITAASDERALESLAVDARATAFALRAEGEVPARLSVATTWPLIAKLAVVDVFALTVFWCVAMAFALRARVRFVAGATASVAFALVAALAFDSGRTQQVGASARDAFAAGELDVESAWFAPVPMGFAETYLDEASRPPSWTAAAEMTSDGRFVRARAGAIDATGFEPLPTPVVARFGEPALNSWRRHLLGTDSLGRDLLARLVWGARTSLLVGAFAAGLASLLGLAIGALAGYFGGWLDVVVERVIETTLAFPSLFLVMCALYFIDPRVVTPLVAVAVVLALVNWTSTARLVRAETLRLRELEFVSALRSLGFSEARILALHVVPNALAPALVTAAFGVGTAMLAEAALAFLGLGVQIPAPSWGASIGEARASEHWWLWLFPGLVLFATVAAFQSLAEALRSTLDPREAIDA